MKLAQLQEARYAGSNYVDLVMQAAEKLEKSGKGHKHIMDLTPEQQEQAERDFDKVWYDPENDEGEWQFEHNGKTYFVTTYGWIEGTQSFNNLHLSTII